MENERKDVKWEIIKGQCKAYFIIKGNDNRSYKCWLTPINIWEETNERELNLQEIQNEPEK